MQIGDKIILGSIKIGLTCLRIKREVKLMTVLEVKNIYKKLGKREIIKGVNFSVEEGEIFGFLGPNGAGKTTTIRMLVGLIHADKGSISIMGHDLYKEREAALSYVGAVVENPELYGYLSGRENLMQIARIRKIPKSEVDNVIELVGMKDRINDKVRKYSLGMKQRLGLAAALLPNPKLLILDEPTNGLDPSGILDFRAIVKKVAREKNTSVFVSSHILSEVQQMCDKVAFINGGVIKSVESIIDGGVTNERETLVVVTREGEDCESLLKSMDLVYDVFKEEDNYVAIAKEDSSPEIIEGLIKSGVKVKEVYKKHKGLEQRYMELVEGGIR